jgi:hypothetical protein
VGRLRDKPTGDLMVLMIATTVCSSVFVGGAALVVLAVVRPDLDTSNFARNIADLLNTLIGLLAGFLAGRTDANVTANKRLLEMEQELMKRPKPPEEEKQ